MTGPLANVRGYRPEALGFDPVLVKRLRRQRSRRNRMRAGGPEAEAAR